MTMPEFLEREGTDTPCTGNYACRVGKFIQLRNVPDALRRKLKTSAAKAGMSLSGYLLTEIKAIAEVPTVTEFRKRLRRHEPVTAEIDSARIIREHRDAA
jgi:antitoxin FitA